MEAETDDEVFTHESALFKLRVKAGEDGVTIRLDREGGNGLPLYDTLQITYDEAEWLRIVLMEALG
jgi:hypothetical protein